MRQVGLFFKVFSVVHPLSMPCPWPVTASTLARYSNKSPVRPIPRHHVSVIDQHCCATLSALPDMTCYPLDNRRTVVHLLTTFFSLEYLKSTVCLRVGVS